MVLGVYLNLIINEGVNGVKILDWKIFFFVFNYVWYVRLILNLIVFNISVDLVD